MSESRIGDVRPARNLQTSAIEQRVRQAVAEAGYPVQGRRMSVLCRHPQRDGDLLALTPDIVLADHKIAIEVDPLGPAGHGYSHADAEPKDRVRNQLLEEAGWTVIRLRLGGTAGCHLGERDVVVESSGLTAAARSALLDAIADAIAQRPAQVRVINKGKTPAKARRRSHVVNIGDYRYADDGHIFTWYPSLDSDEKRTLRLALNGRFLYTHAPGWHGTNDNRLIAEVGLNQHPRTDWRKLLEVILADTDPATRGTTKWPWGGDRLFLYEPGSNAGQEVVERSAEFENIDKASFYFTTNISTLARWDIDRVSADDDEPIATLHPGALQLGYRITAVEVRNGYRGAYQRIDVSRNDH